ncbi:MAG TPA: GDYXXLXY domain-containing protein [Nitrospiria bacterium]|jgi:uncharacterized membrane-anchored protein|nr:GDYXXLXY domain-containing protein [Nitrospiria bacterium]
MTKQTKFILAITLQAVIIFGIIIYKISILAAGTEILLKIVPADPRDVLRGDFATFQYSAISHLDEYVLNGQPFGNGDTVYVVLRQIGTYWSPQKVQKNRPSDEAIFLKGKVESGGTETGSSLLPRRRFGDSRLHVVYGIEDYFIPEGKGQGVRLQNKEAAALVVVDENGDAFLEQVYVDDKTWP